MADRLPGQLRSDCSRCAALCCIAYAAEAGPGFPATKEAGEPCPNLDSCGNCRIYDRREEEGFTGCIAFECFGAGQHVVQELYGGRDWRTDPALLEPILASFRVARKAFELAFLARHAKESGADGTAMDAIEGELTGIASWRDTKGADAALSALEAQLKAVFSAIVRD